MIETIPVKETRERLANLIDNVYVGRKTYIITKFGKPRAILAPIDDSQKKSNNFSESLSKSFGIWKKRKDIQDTDAWVRKMRRKISLRK